MPFLAYEYLYGTRTHIPLLSSAYIAPAKTHCFKFEVQEIARAFSRALLSAGNNIPARIAMIAMTTVTSTNCKTTENEQKTLTERKNYEKFVQVHPH